MVRWLGLFLVLALVLCGCTQESEPATNPTEESVLSTEATQPSEPSGLYLPQSPVEMETNGAMQSFLLESNDYYGCASAGDKFLLIRNKDGAGELSLYTGDNLTLLKTISLGNGVMPALEQLQISEKGIGYYDPIDRAVVFLDWSLLELGRMKLPEEMEGDAWLSPDWKTVYYCQSTGMYALDLQTGIARSLKEQRMYSQKITGLLGGGNVIRCEVETQENQKNILLIDSTSGVVLGEGQHLANLQTHGDWYFIPVETAPLPQLRFGTETDNWVFWPPEGTGKLYPLLEQKAVVVVDTLETGLSISYYNLNSGLLTGKVTLSSIQSLWGIQPGANGTVWFFAGQQDGQQTLYRWNPGKSPVEDEQIYTAPYFTPENPDQEGLDFWKEQYEELGERFHVEILLWQDAVATAPADHVFTGEHMTQIYEKALPELEKAMSSLPEKFLKKAGNGRLKIALVRAMAGDPQWGSLEKSTNLQFWQADVPVIALALSGNLEQNFYHALAHLIDTKVLSKSTALYEWNKLNPEGFAYDNNYITNQDRVDLSYVEGEDRYFIDLFSMSYAKEDRARIFEYACMPGNEEYFEAPVIQEKLRRICKGIREAFGLKKVETAFLWEQYLDA